MIKLVNLLRENIESNIVNDVKTLSKEDFLEKYSAEFKKFGTYEPHGFISINNNQPYIRLNDETIEVTPSEYNNWNQLKLKQEYDTSKPVLLKYTGQIAEYNRISNLLNAAYGKKGNSQSNFESALAKAQRAGVDFDVILATDALNNPDIAANAQSLANIVRSVQRTATKYESSSQNSNCYILYL